MASPGGGGLYPTIMPSARNINPMDREQEESVLSKLSKDSLYFFEVTTCCLPAGCDACVGLVLDKVGASAGEFIPGETRDSIGLDSTGTLRVGGRIIETEALQSDSFRFRGGKIEGFGEGDIVGCGVEVSGPRRVFFTKNGRIIVPPTRFGELDLKKNLYAPAFGAKVGRNQEFMATGNFGVETNRPFIWAYTGFLAHKAGEPKPPMGSTPRNRSFPVRPNKKTPNRQQSAPATPTQYEAARSPHQANRPARQIDSRNATSLSPALGIYGRQRRPGQRRDAPTLSTDDQDLSDSEGGHTPGKPVNGGMHEHDRRASEIDRMHSSLPHFDSDWQNGHDDESAFLSTTSAGRPGMEFSAINENEDLGDPFAAQAPVTDFTTGLRNYPEEEKTAIGESDMVGPSGAGGALTPDETEGMRENVRMLRSVCRDDTAVEASFLESLLDCCRADQQTLKVALDKAMTNEDPDVDLMELIGLNELVLEAVQLGEETIKSTMQKAEAAAPPTPLPAVAVAAEPPPQQPKSSNNLDLDINGLIRKKDVFSLICILRAQSEQRLDAALALMEFAKDGERPEEGGISLRDEIRSSGGMHSLLQVFRAKGTSYELRVVAGMAVAYVLPSFVESSPSVGLKIMECLRFLSISRDVTPNGVRISKEMMFKASAMGVTAFWMNALEPMLQSGTPVDDISSERSDLHMMNSSVAGFAAGGIFDQGHQTLELQELLEMTVSLIVHIEKNCESESMMGNNPQESAAMAMWRYTNVEQVCTVDVARPIAVREGLLPILVEWIKSNDKDKIRPAVSALRYLTSIKDKYMAGWIHSQMVNEGALAEVIKLADDYNAGHDVRLAVAQILASLCVAPHTRAAVVEARCMLYLIGFLYDHSDQASEEVALFAGRAITQLAAGAITRASVFGGGDTEILDFVSPDKRDSLVEYVVSCGQL